jgi:erythromycin esterase-like protein
MRRREGQETVRTLIHAPVIHTEADLGTMAAPVQHQFRACFGADAWARRASAVEAMWDGLRAKLLARPLAWARVRLYQDGLPVCGKEEAIAREVAARSSRNHRLLVELIELGATLVGTEDPALLVREYARVMALLEAAARGVSAEQMRALELEGDEILRLRDAFIAQRIDATLAEGETGILFIGLMHRVDPHLGEGFTVERLIHDLPLEAGPSREIGEVGGNGG